MPLLPLLHRTTGRRLLLLGAAALTCMLALGCSKSPVERLVDRSVGHLQAALDLMQAAQGDEKRLLEAALRYRNEHHAEIAALRKEGEALLAKMSGEERRQLETSARKRAAPVLAAIELEAKKFPNPQMALRFIRPIIGQSTPKSGGLSRIPWLPDVPDLPLMPDPAELRGLPPGSDPHRGHDHAPPGPAPR